MVYCGPPSKGCFTCRKRKIRCDQATPSCGQCAKSYRVCPGYRNQVDLAFRNESDLVIAKMKKTHKVLSKAQVPEMDSFDVPVSDSAASTTSQVWDFVTEWDPSEINLSSASKPDKSPGRPSGNPSSRSRMRMNLIRQASPARSSRQSEDHRLVPSSCMSTFSLVPSLEERGINIFVANYVERDSALSSGHFSWVYLVHHDDNIDELLATSMNAVGSAVYANTSRSSQLALYARKQYTSALQMINAALESPIQCVKDSTLGSILLVSVFETMMGNKRLSLKAWTEHVNGASALLKLRGHRQLDSELGAKLFIQVSGHVMVSCLQRRIHLPAYIKELKDIARQRAKNVMSYMEEFIDFWADLKQGMISEPETIMDIALSFETRLVAQFEKFPAQWQCRLVEQDDFPGLTFHGAYDIYANRWTCQMWNSMRLCRLLVNDIIRETIVQGFSLAPQVFTTTSYLSRYQTSTEILAEMRNGILRSVPQSLGLVTEKPWNIDSTAKPQDSSLSERGMPSSDFASGCSENHILSGPGNLSQQQSFKLRDKPFLPSIGGYQLLWPLYVAGKVRMNTPAIREVVEQRLRFIGDELGIVQASALANFLAQDATMCSSGFTSSSSSIRADAPFEGFGDSPCPAPYR